MLKRLQPPKTPKPRRSALETTAVSSAKPSLWFVHLCLLVAQVCYGGGSVVGRLGLSHTNPIAFAFYREIIAGPLMLFLAFHFTDDKFQQLLKQWRLFVVGGVSLFFGQALFIMGLKLSGSPFMAAAWQCLQPVTGMALGLAVGRELVDSLKLTGIALTIFGTMIVSFDNPNAVNNAFISSLLFFANGIFSVVYLMFGTPKPLQLFSSATVTAACYCIASVLMCATLCALYCSTFFTDALVLFVCADCEPSKAFILPHSGAMFALIYFVLFQSMLAYWLITYAVSHCDTSVNVAYSAAQPIATVLISQLLIANGLVDQCVAAASNHTCLNGVDRRHFAAVFIVGGLYCLFRSEERRKKAPTPKNASFSDASNLERDNLLINR